MHEILKELNLPGNLTHPVIIPRKSNQTSSSKEIAVQLELPIIDVEEKSSNKE